MTLIRIILGQIVIVYNLDVSQVTKNQNNITTNKTIMAGSLVNKKFKLKKNAYVVIWSVYLSVLT